MDNGKWRIEDLNLSAMFNLFYYCDVKKNIVKDKSFAFALEVISLYKYLCFEKQEYVLSKQLLRSGTAVGALVREAEQAESKKDFIHKMSISLKEANETEYWLLLLEESDYLSEVNDKTLLPGIMKLKKILISIIKTSKTNLGN